MASMARVPGYSTEGSRVVRRMDWGLLGAALLLLGFGLMAQYSVGGGLAGPYFRKQLVFVLVGLVPFAIFGLVHPRSWQRGAVALYVFNLLLLAAVLVAGRNVKGAERWIPLPGGFQFQPSELAKLLLVLTLSTFYAYRQEAITRLSTYLLGLAHVVVPVLFILKQPHLGAALVVLVMWFAVSLVAGVPARFLAATLACGAVLVAGILAIPQTRGLILKDYQQKRIAGLQSRQKDTQGRNWQTDRAEIAFGVGGVMGTGFMRGEQKQAGFVPEQHNDFIVTVVGEEGGLVGCTLLLATFGFFFYRVFLVMLNAGEPFYRMVAAGVFAVLGFHTFVNIAMVLQILPVVGLWLPFLSYGGTAMWLCLACVGLLLSVRRRERPVLF